MGGRILVRLRARPQRPVMTCLVLVELLHAGWKAEWMGAITTEQLQAIADQASELLSALVPAAVAETVAGQPADRG